MTTLAERLRVRSGPKTIYTLDDVDEDGLVQERDQTTQHVEGTIESEEVFTLGEIDKILDREFRPTAPNDPDSDNGAPSQVIVKQYLVKWKRLSYLHCSWVPEQEFEKAYKSHPRLKLKARLNKFNATMDDIISDNGDDFIAIRPEWTTVDRIIACRGEDDGKEYLVKYKELSYGESYWEAESDISAFHNEIQRFKDINSGSRRDKYVENGRNQMEFKHFDHTPEFLTGSLHRYQLEGLNSLRYSWSKGTNVILADEMGLGKTIQSIAFLACLFEENQAPHLVVAPLSTLRNWEREFATWAPHLNVVMYTGTSEARHVIRDHEFYFPEGNKKIKFDVLLTSYEMINLDTAVLKPINWNCMIVDEGHRLKNKNSKLFSSLKQYTSKHRVLLTGTPLQNNLDELFVLMHFLDGAKFGSLDGFQEEFKDINQEEQISRLHKMLAPHLLRRVKKDVLKDMLPPKKELILRVDLSSQQKHLYKAIITRNYQILAKKGGGKISNVLMELRKVCSHPYQLEGVEPKFEDANEAFKQLLEASGKLQLLDKMMVKLKEQGHRVLIYSQFRHTLDLFEDYCSYKNWFYERIDGKVGGAERQVRIDRFNAENSNRFCFLLSTRAGGIGINLATADTVIIYDSDWNPHADLQAMARAHRLGQTNKVMIYRLIHRGTVEERMMEMTKKKMLLEHLVVGKMKEPNLSQDELDDIIKYGSKELFTKENDEAGNSGKIRYDDAAIEKLLDREYIDAEEVSEDDEEENGFLKAFKVANFEYIDENDAAALEESQGVAAALEEEQAIENNSDRTSYWEGLLKDKVEVHQADELNALGKRKRKCKQMISLKEDDLDGLEVSSDESYEAEPTDGEAARQGNPVVKKPTRRRVRENSGPIPLMEGEGESLRVLGFNKAERKLFEKTFMRYGVDNYDWKEFVHHLKKKTYDEIKAYGILFLKHVSEDSRDSSPTFSDGVPKEETKCGDVLERIALLLLFKEKCKFLEDNPAEPVFPDHIYRMFQTKRTFWQNVEHDKILIRAVFKHGHGSWLSIVDDKEFRPIEEPLCKYMDYPFPYRSLSGGEQAGSPESSLYKKTGTAENNNASADKGQSNATLHPVIIHRRLGDQVRRRVAVLEDALKYEHAEKMRAEQAEAETKVMDTVGTSFVAADKEMRDGLPKNDPITSEEISAVAVDNKQYRVEEDRSIMEEEEEDDVEMDAADIFIVLD